MRFSGCACPGSGRSCWGEYDVVTPSVVSHASLLLPSSPHPLTPSHCHTLLPSHCHILHHFTLTFSHCHTSPHTLPTSHAPLHHTPAPTPSLPPTLTSPHPHLPTPSLPHTPTLTSPHPHLPTPPPLHTLSPPTNKPTHIANKLCLSGMVKHQLLRFSFLSTSRSATDPRTILLERMSALLSFYVLSLCGHTSELFYRFPLSAMFWQPSPHLWSYPSYWT